MQRRDAFDALDIALQRIGGSRRVRAGKLDGHRASSLGVIGPPHLAGAGAGQKLLQFVLSYGGELCLHVRILSQRSLPVPPYVAADHYGAVTKLTPAWCMLWSDAWIAMPIAQWPAMLRLPLVALNWPFPSGCSTIESVPMAMSCMVVYS